MIGIWVWELGVKPFLIKKSYAPSLLCFPKNPEPTQLTTETSKLQRKENPRHEVFLSSSLFYSLTLSLSLAPVCLFPPSLSLSLSLKFLSDDVGAEFWMIIKKFVQLFVVNWYNYRIFCSFSVDVGNFG
jgi:hypothetical protein